MAYHVPSRRNQIQFGRLSEYFTVMLWKKDVCLVEDVVEGRAAGVVGRRDGVHDGVEGAGHQETVGAEALAQLRVAVCKGDQTTQRKVEVRKMHG